MRAGERRATRGAILGYVEDGAMTVMLHVRERNEGTHEKGSSFAKTNEQGILVNGGSGCA